MRDTGAERPVRAMKSGKLDGAKGSRHPACPDGQPRAREEPSSHAKPFRISKWVVWEAYTRVKANHGAAGVDAESVEMFEQDLKNNLYRIWNRMSSGTYFPPPVRSVGIPKKDGSERRLGIPTVADRIAQTVVKMYLEPDVEPQFHPDSYGYRPRKSAIDALTTTRQRCWRYDWVIDLDIRGFFDNLDHALVMRAVRKYTRCRWILLYVQRWLTAPMQQEDGTLVPRTMGRSVREVRGRYRRALEGRPKGASRARSWPISSCTSRSTTGCGRRTRTFRSRGTRTISSRTVGRRRRRSRSCRTSNVVWRNAGWTSIRRRRTSSTVRMTTGRGSIPRSSSPSWDTRFARVGRRIGGVSTSSTSRRQ